MNVCSFFTSAPDSFLLNPVTKVLGSVLPHNQAGTKTVARSAVGFGKRIWPLRDLRKRFG